ncbi:hypothetical protein Ahy_A07g031734 isoform A [Arachis hypogaea]|uniref:Uncharacterized protein n=1 Tax=Arachis hypogaea TaxID=3818 RepID=A0A445C4Y3_ARAHY|nr:hypothetical protein Ahy_A07g031734 isoform A [Arachis hypogaea]
MRKRKRKSSEICIRNKTPFTISFLIPSSRSAEHAWPQPGKNPSRHHRHHRRREEPCLPPSVAVRGLSPRVFVRHSQGSSPSLRSVRSNQSQAHCFFLELGRRRVIAVVCHCCLSPSVAVRGLSPRSLSSSVGIIQVKPPVRCLFPRSAPILHRIRPACRRLVAVALSKGFQVELPRLVEMEALTFLSS